MVDIPFVACLPSDLRSFEVWVVAKYGRLRLCEVELFTEPLPTVTQVGQQSPGGLRRYWELRDRNSFKTL